ncbi:hypothetical protein C4A75_20150 [Brevibacillus laterosporus]|uniref:GntR family transcriptional regulator n=1 Tax=Brevibacillus laterosporus TaxID=1465 RepID=UPI000CE5116D|nr:winged helix-turn-helix domain-containing protein [Brevibacillus laterosporus]PPA82107.1 hypothetical protein C4A75_20150 [Brevibacillus laterosporus]
MHLIQYISGQFHEQAKLPSIRKLADLLGISTTPVEQAYQQLVSEGFVVSKPKQGYYVQSLSEIYVQRVMGYKKFLKAGLTHLNYKSKAKKNWFS